MQSKTPANKRAVERGRGLALLLFLIILLLFIIPFAEILPKDDDSLRFANLAIGKSGELLLHPCTGVNEDCQQLKGEKRQKFSSFLFAKMDINTASFAELTTIRGVGEKMAGEICALRRKKAICSKEDLLLLKNVGKKRAEYLQQFFSFCKKDNNKTL